MSASCSFRASKKEFTSTQDSGFELTYRDSGNTMHFLLGGYVKINFFSNHVGCPFKICGWMQKY